MTLADLCSDFGSEMGNYSARAYEPHQPTAASGRWEIRAVDDDPRQPPSRVWSVVREPSGRALAQPLGGGRFLPPHNPIDAAAN
jgi:hypothetical protein